MDVSRGHAESPVAASPDTYEARLSAAAMIVQCTSLPSLPAAYIRLVEAINDAYSSTADLARIIEQDAALTARVLKVVNSALYRIGAPVESVSRALAIVGVEQLHHLAFSTSTIEAFNRVPQDLLDMDSFWKHSLGTAVTSRIIAAKCGYRNTERLFVTGLLHDVGRLVMCLGEPDLTASMMRHARSADLLLHEVESQEMGCDHAVVAREFLRSWSLPDTITEPVGAHHSPLEAGEYAREASILHLADVTAHALLPGSSGAHLVPPISDSVWPHVGTDWTVSEIAPEIDFQFRVAKQAILS